MLYVHSSTKDIPDLVYVLVVFVSLGKEQIVY